MVNMSKIVGFFLLNFIATGRVLGKSLHGTQLDLSTNKKYVLSNSEYVQCNFFIFDHVVFIQFKICCCVQNLIEIG